MDLVIATFLADIHGASPAVRFLCHGRHDDAERPSII
jgi:hypothetical protein